MVHIVQAMQIPAIRNFYCAILINWHSCEFPCSHRLANRNTRALVRRALRRSARPEGTIGLAGVAANATLDKLHWPMITHWRAGCPRCVLCRRNIGRLRRVLRCRIWRIAALCGLCSSVVPIPRTHLARERLCWRLSVRWILAGRLPSLRSCVASALALGRVRLCARTGVALCARLRPSCARLARA